jgi:phosphatidylinositol glycan class B
MKFERSVFFIALAVYGIAAWFSTGFYHGDEHYQIIEFALHRMGSNTTDQLAWEFAARVRPAIQPFLAFLVIRSLNLLSLPDPYFQAFVLRLLTAIFALISIRFFTRSSREMVRADLRKAYLLLSYFLWFLPFINVRFSSETWSGLLLLNALAVQLGSTPERRKFWIIGALLGGSFLFRYQNAFLGGGLILWMLVIGRIRAVNLLRLAASGFGVLLLGILLDYWMYGKFVLSWWNYFHVNLVEGVASSYGTEAWWNYFYSIFRFGFFPIGLPIILALLLFLFRQPKHVLTWTVLPFFIIHCIIPHKELRFLFPVVNLVPLILVLAWQGLKPGTGSRQRLNRRVLRPVLGILMLLNCVALVTVCLKPADDGFMTVTRYIRYHYGEEPLCLVSYDHSNPYGPWGLMATFYQEAGMQDLRLDSLEDLGEGIFDGKRRTLLVLKREHARTVPVRRFLREYGGRKAVQAIPSWMEPLMTLYGGFHMERIQELYVFSDPPGTGMK